MAKRRERIKTAVKDRLDHEIAVAQAEGLDLAPIGTPENPSDAVLTLANFITLCRLALTLAFLALFVTRSDRVTALVLYAVAASTDFLDGQVARRTQTVSWVGKVMDPIMDRVLLFTGVLGLVVTGELPIWIAFFVIGRDLYLAGGSLVLQKYRHRPLDVIFIGKAATALLMFGFCDLLLGVPRVAGLSLITLDWLPGLNGQSVALGMMSVYLGVICSTVTALIYTKTGLQIRSESKSLGRRLDADDAGEGMANA